MWCYFSLVQSISRLLGAPASAAGPRSDEFSLTLSWDLAVAWSDGTRLVYNPRFSRSRSVWRRSYSVPLRPDIALEVPRGPNKGLHLLDAKFKVDTLQTVFSRDGAEDDAADEVAEERRGTFKRGDLYKMHAYRDAIREARSVWVIYPGSEMRFFSRSEVAQSASALPVILEGVGALPLVPLVGSRLVLDHLLQRLLREAEM